MAENLVHAYDAVKRREYYLRTRKLKGRTKAARPKPPKKTRAQRQAERRRKLEADVAALKGRLEKLQAVLAELTKAAKARSGVKDKATPKKSTSSTKKAAAQKLTPTQKAKAAKAAEEYRKKNPDKALSEDIKSLNAKIKTIQERIAKMRRDGSIGAKKTTK